MSKDTQFKEGNTAGKGRGKNKRTLYLDALKDELKLDCQDAAESEFYQFCIKVGMVRHQYMEETQEGRDVVFGKPDPQLLKDAMSRLYPQSKATYPAYEFEFPEDGTMVEKSDAILNAFAKGQIPIDAASHAFNIIKDRALIEEKHDTLLRIEALEETLK